MMVSINKATEVYANVRTEMNRVKRSESLTVEGKVQALKELDSYLANCLESWKEEVAQAQEALREAAEAQKPTATGRTVDSNTAATMTYLADTLLARMALEGGQAWGLKAFLAELTKESGDQNAKQAFMDNYHKFVQLVENLPHKRVDYLKDAHREIEKQIQSPKQTAYENAIAEAEKNVNSLSTKLIAAERTVSDLRASIAATLHEFTAWA